MKTGRRIFLSGAAAMLAGTHALLTNAQRHDQGAQMPPFPGPPGPNAAPDDVPLPPRADPKTQLKEEQKILDALKPGEDLVALQHAFDALDDVKVADKE